MPNLKSKKIRRSFVGGEVKRTDTMNDFLRSDIIILVMGPTSAGKSTFINALAGRDIYLGSHTSDIQHYILTYPKDSTRRVILIDIPDFDDPISRHIPAWIAKMHRNKSKVTGIIYLHDISQSRMLEMSPNIELLHKLYEETTRNVILATTKWDCVWDELGWMRVRELGEYWKRMFDLGSVVCQLLGTSKSAWEVVQMLVLNFAQRAAIPLSLTREASSVGVDEKEEVMTRHIPTLDKLVEIKTSGEQSLEASSEKQEKPKGNRFRSVLQLAQTPKIPRSNRAAHTSCAQEESVEMLVEPNVMLSRRLEDGLRIREELIDIDRQEGEHRVQRGSIKVSVEAEKKEVEDRRALDKMLKELLDTQKATFDLVLRTREELMDIDRREGGRVVHHLPETPKATLDLLKKVEDNRHTLHSTLQRISAPNVLPSRRLEDAPRIREESTNIDTVLTASPVPLPSTSAHVHPPPSPPHPRSTWGFPSLTSTQLLTSTRPIVVRPSTV